MKAAGILLVSMNGKALFLHRTPTAPDCPSCYDFPGGGSEGGETPEETARRECREETGYVPEGTLRLHTRTRSGSALKGVAGVGGPLLDFPVDGGPPSPPPAAPEPAAAPIGDVDYTTFLLRVTNEFVPELDAGHDGFSWAPIDSPPEPLHPGCRIALARLSMNELDVARAIARGDLVSPQRYENVTLWAIRITGTGASYRPKVGEFVYRSADHHLTPDAVARCNGLPVILKHPKKALLDSEEFGKRIVGTIFLPYVAADELWGIAKIYDDDANKLMGEEDLSTSPGVNLDPRISENRIMHVEEIGKVLVEGDPSLFDHVAICQLGVWDKGEEPSGIRSEAREDSAMAEETKKEETKADAKVDAAKKDEGAEKKVDAKADAKKDEGGEEKKADDWSKKLDGIADSVRACADAVGSLTKRVDAIEVTKTDAKVDAKKDEFPEKKEEEKGAEKTAADAKKDTKTDAKKDETGETAKEDTAKADSAEMRTRIAAVETAVKDTRSMIVPLSDDDHSRLADAWARADDACVALGVTTPRAMPGEASIKYRRRVADLLKPFSTTWSKIDLSSTAFADEASFSIVESQILAESAIAAQMPVNVQPGRLRETKRESGGHTIKEFKGHPRDWMNQFAGNAGLKATGKFLHNNLGNRAD